MIRNIYTIERLLSDFKQLEGCKLYDCFTQEPDTIHLAFDDGDELVFLEFRADSINDALYLRKRFNRSANLAKELFPKLHNQFLQKVELIGKDRIVHFQFSKNSVYFLVYGRGKSNMIITQNGNIKDLLFADLGFEIGAKLNLDVFEPKMLCDLDKSIKLRKALPFSSAQLSQEYLLDFLESSGYNPDKLLGDFEDSELLDIENKALEYRKSIQNANQFYHLESQKGDMFFAAKQLANHNIIKEFSDIHQAIGFRIFNSMKQKVLDALKKPMLNQLDKIVRQTKATIERTSNTDEFEARENKYRLAGEILLSSGNTKQRGLDEIEMYDWEGNLLKIDLDAKFNIAENANRYFTKAKKAKEELNQLLLRLPKLEEKLAQASMALEELVNINSEKEIQKFAEKYKLLINTKTVQKNLKQEDKFKKFDINGKFVLYVGKNAANNDELTVKFAKPNDLWFHARDVSGSHCVLRLNAGEQASREVLEKCAQIAAFYSQSRNGTFVPVSYTFKKYVVKPKGAHPGSVRMMREEVIMVEPKAPSAE